MGLLEQIKDLALNGPQDWRTRIRSTIELTSPEGAEFSALWRSGPRTFDKKLGIFNYPKVRGNIVQDLDVTSTKYSLSFFFDGKNHDKTAHAFFAACRERGTWTVTHPIHGFLDLQLVSVRQIDDPVESAGITAIESDWIEPIDPETLKTSAELAANILDAIDEINVSAAQQFADNLNQRTEAFSRAVETATTRAAAIIDTATKPLYDSIDALETAVSAVQQALNDTITETTILTDSLAGQIQNLVQMPSVGSGSGSARVDRYAGMVNDTSSSVLPSIVRQPEKAKNEIAVAELTMVAAVGAVAKVALTAGVVTRAQALALAVQTLDLFDSAVESLDESQELLDEQFFVNQFFSQTLTYSTGARLVLSVRDYLLSLTPSLKVEQRLVLDRPRSPIEIVITEIGGGGDIDENLDEFIAVNELKGDEIILLDRGREITIYA